MNFHRSIAAAVFVFALTVSPVAHADTAFNPTGPFADAFQFWSTIVTSIDSLAHELATAFIPHQSQLTDSSNPHTSNNLNATPATNPFTAAVADALPNTATSSQNTSTATSDQTTQTPFVKSPVSQSATSNSAVSSTPTATIQSAPFTQRTIIEQVPEDTANFVTPNQFNALSNRLSNLTNIVGNLASLLPTLSQPQNSAATPQQIAGDGNPEAIGAGAAIDQLSNVTITNPSIAGLSANDIPNLSGSYLSLGGGTLTGPLVDSTAASSSFTGALGIGTTSPSDVLAVNGPIYLANVTPAATTNRLYSNAGSLYWAGSLIGGGSVGNWATDGTSVWRTGGNVGIGTTSPFTALSVVGNGYLTGTLTAAGINATNATTPNIVATNATTTSLFATNASTTNISASGEGYFQTASTTNLTVTSATTTNLGVTGTALTSNLVASNSFTLGTLTGILHAAAGAVSASLVNLASDVTGILPVANGGTGWSNIAVGAIPYGNGSSALATTSTGTAGQILALLNGVPTWTATTTLATISGTLTVASGGTGSTTLSGILVGNGASAVKTATLAGSLSLSGSALSDAWTLSGSNLYNNSGTNIGVGTTTPWATLSIQATSGQTNPLFLIASTTGAASAISLAVAANGNVGIGTTTPFEQLTVTNGTPQFAGSVTTGLSQPSNVYVQGRYAYVADRGNNTFSIFDISNPAAPVQISSTSNGLVFPNGIYVQGRYAYVTSQNTSALVIFDVSNPAVPVEVGSVSTTDTNGADCVYVQGRYAYLGTKATNSFVVVDVSNPAAPVEVGSIPDGSNSNGVEIFVQGDYAYTLDNADVLFTIFNVSNPTVPVKVAATSTDLSAPLKLLYVQGRYAYVVSAGNSSLVIFDISNPASPTEVGSISTGLSTPSDIYIQGRYAYVTDHNNSLVTFDVSNPASPVEVGSISTNINFPQALFVQGRYAYVASQNNSSLDVFDLGGGYVQQLETGGVETGTLSARNNIFGMDEALSGGLSVGSNLNVNGSFGLTASTFNATTTAGKSYSIFSLNTASSTSPLFTALYNGDIGIGYTAPTSALDVNGNVGIGTTTPYSTLEVWGPNSGASTTAFLVANSASTTEFAVYDNGNATLAGGLTQNSDQRLKTNIQSLNGSSTLAAIDNLNPVTFNWIDPNKGRSPQFGFIAQQVLPIFPTLVSTTSPTALTPNGTLSLNYIGLISPIVSAIQALSSEIASIESTIANFAQSFTTTVLNSQQDNTQKLCVGSTCVTPAQFQAMVAAANQSSAPQSSVSGGASLATTDSNTSPSPAATDTPPVIQINGDNPAIIQIGATYTDLGATITSPQQDHNLGIQAIVDGGATTTIGAIAIDSSQPATHTIEYVATDQNGLQATAVRTVNIIAPTASMPSPDATSTGPSTNDSSNTAASTTTATTTAQ